ncbi:pilus assembly protein PilP [Lampropedia aestuarii]|uniref:pilus assembly protein PilP n=1 Tax=Lampropedia aestuarii TaxID=2562762 RepID=UPI002469B587|nr:pilus assembly protein PilP [Lampropedia aestuarii]MDH5856963.1 pilus assembly protein PilP [Lampropedia aestuarii]
MNNSLFQSVILLVIAIGVAGCMDSRESGVAEWMAREKSQAAPKVQPLAAPIVFVPASYTPTGAEDPFSVNKLARVFTQSTKKNNSSLIAAHADRRKEALEAYPLDSIKMVGFLQKEGRPTALLEVEQHLYQAHEGQYLGQNYGRIDKISETQLQLQEIVQDATGDWMERSATIELQE